MKNPFMSIFLSNANRIAGTIRGQAIAAVKRESAKNAKEITKEMTKAWTDALVVPVTVRRKRRTVKK